MDPREDFDVQQMLAGELYRFSDGNEALAKQTRVLVREYNATGDDDRRDQILTELLGSRGENCEILGPIGFDYGWNTHIGENFYANMDLIILDVCEVRIGDDCLFGPRVSLLAATHPTAARPRAEGLEYGLPITIGNNVWLGGSVTVNPGVTIGDGAIIGTGSVVTKDIPAGVIAVGNPCRVLREVSADEERMWEERAAQYWAEKAARP